MSFLRRSPTVGHGAPAAKPVVAEELGAPETFGAFDAPASVEADAECVGEGLALEGVQPPTMSARATNTAPTRLAIKTKHYTGQRVLAERERERERERARTLDGVAPKPHFQFAPEEGSEGLLGPTEVRCRCLEDS
jgi:hypothetical protein